MDSHITLFIFWFKNGINFFQSEKVATFAYLTSWEIFPFKYKIAISFIIFRAQRAIQIFGGKFYVLSIETFISVST